MKKKLNKGTELYSILESIFNMTINEDIHNTFTKRNAKKLNNFSDKFRMFGTSQTNEVNKLSDAVLSRCSLVYASAYSISEQETALKNFIENNNLKFSDKNIKYLFDKYLLFLQKKNFHLFKLLIVLKFVQD